MQIYFAIEYIDDVLIDAVFYCEMVDDHRLCLTLTVDTCIGLNVVLA